MLIFVAGTDSFLAHEAINKLKAKYLEKNPDGAELIEIDCGERKEPNPRTKLSGETASGLLSHGAVGAGQSFADLQAVPLFATSRLVIIRGVGLLPIKDQDDLSVYLKDLPTTTVAVVWDQKPLLVKGALSSSRSENSSRGASLSLICDTATKRISVEPLTGARLNNWVESKAKEWGVTLNSAQSKELIDRFGSDLWAISTELQTLSLIGQQTATWAKSSQAENFLIFRLVRAKKWLAVSQELVAAFDRGEPFELILGSLAAAVRKDVSDKDLRTSLTDLMVDIDVAAKTGLLEPQAAINLLAYHLTQPASARVQWAVEYYG